MACFVFFLWVALWNVRLVERLRENLCIRTSWERTIVSAVFATTDRLGHMQPNDGWTYRASQKWNTLRSVEWQCFPGCSSFPSGIGMTQGSRLATGKVVGKKDLEGLVKGQTL